MDIRIIVEMATAMGGKRTRELRRIGFSSYGHGALGFELENEKDVHGPYADVSNAQIGDFS